MTRCDTKRQEPAPDKDLRQRRHTNQEIHFATPNDTRRPQKPGWAALLLPTLLPSLLQSPTPSTPGRGQPRAPLAPAPRTTGQRPTRCPRCLVPPAPFVARFSPRLSQCPSAGAAPPAFSVFRSRRWISGRVVRCQSRCHSKVAACHRSPLHNSATRPFNWRSYGRASDTNRPNRRIEIAARRDGRCRGRAVLRQAH
jgi:hypothetical protein